MVWDNDADTERRVEQAVLQTGYLTTYHSSVCVIFDLLMDKSTATLNVFKEDTGHTELPLDLKGVSKSNWSRIYGDVATSKGKLFKVGCNNNIIPLMLLWFDHVTNIYLYPK